MKNHSFLLFLGEDREVWMLNSSGLCWLPQSVCLPRRPGVITDIPYWITVIRNASTVLLHPLVKWNSDEDRRVHCMRGCDQSKGSKEVFKTQNSVVEVEPPSTKPPSSSLIQRLKVAFCFHLYQLELFLSKTGLAVT